MTHCPVLTPEQRQSVELIGRLEKVMMGKIVTLIGDVGREADKGLKAISSDEFPPQQDYFLAVAHRQLFLRLCGADPETGKGGDPDVASAILNSDRNFIAVHWE